MKIKIQKNNLKPSRMIRNLVEDPVVPVFERVYIPPCNHDKQEIKKLVEVALKNGFECTNCTTADKEAQIEELTRKPNYYIVLQKFEDSLTIGEKQASQVLSHIRNGITVLSPEKGIEWIKQTKKNQLKIK